MDYEISRKIWDSKIPVEISLESDDLLEPVKPFYAMMQRCSYLSVVIPKAVQYFLTCNEQISLDLDSIWLECNRVPLKPYYPIGVLFDLTRRDDSLPWRITLKTGKSDVTYSLGRDVMQSMLIQTIKEADYLKRKAAVVNAMKSEDHKQLWSGIVNNQFDDFWAVNKRLMECSDSDPFLHIPIRLYKNGFAFKQVPITPSNQGRLTTLYDAVSALSSEEEAKSGRFVCHGIEVPGETPLIWMARNFSYPDNFVHVCLLDG